MGLTLMSAVHLDGTDATADDAARCALGARLAAYIWDKHKSKATKSKKDPLSSIVIVSDDPKAAQAAYAPPNEIYPKAYADRIEGLRSLGLEVEVLGEPELNKLGMHALLGVGLGSERERKQARRLPALSGKA